MAFCCVAEALAQRTSHATDRSYAADRLHFENRLLSHPGGLQPTAVNWLARPRASGGYRHGFLLSGQPRGRLTEYSPGIVGPVQAPQSIRDWQLPLFPSLLGGFLRPERSPTSGVHPADAGSSIGR